MIMIRDSIYLQSMLHVYLKNMMQQNLFLIIFHFSWKRMAKLNLMHSELWPVSPILSSSGLNTLESIHWGLSLQTIYKQTELMFNSFLDLDLSQKQWYWHFLLL